MLKRSLIPTPLVDPAKVPPIRIAAQARLKRAGSFRLFFRLLRFGMALGVAKNVQRRSDAQLAVMAREFLEGLGGLWIKAGQLLSLRVDLLTPEMADQLSQLQHQSFGFDPAVAQQVIERELGRPIAEVFDSFETHPFAAASISQLHRATLRGTDTVVAIKVQRPGMEKVLARDLGLITWLLRRMKRVPMVSYIGWDGMARELERMLHEEVDYRYEVANLRRMRKILKAHRIYVPKVFRALSTQKVIVMEFLPGVVMSDYLRVRRTDPKKLQAWERSNGIEPRRVGKRLMLSFYRQLYEETIFHGDLHPGNIILLQDSRIALIDFGTVGSLEHKFVQVYGQMARAIATGDYGKSMDLYLLLCDSIPPIDTNRYRAESVEIIRAWEARTHLDGLSFLERSITGGLSTDLAAVNRKYKVNPSWQFLRVARSVGTMDANLGVLLEKDNPTKLLKTYFLQSRRRAAKRLGREALNTVTNTIADIADTAGQLSGVILRQTIQVQGAQSKASQILALFAGVVRFALVVAGIVIVYDFLEANYFGIVAGVDPYLGAFGDFIDSTPEMPLELGFALIFGVIVVIFVVGRIRAILRRDSIRLPDGRRDH